MSLAADGEYQSNDNYNNSVNYYEIIITNDSCTDADISCGLSVYLLRSTVLYIYMYIYIYVYLYIFIYIN